MSAPATIRRLAQEAWDEITDETGDTDDEALRIAADEQVTSMTTLLFQLVVEDNALGFLEYDGEATNPFDVLRGAIVEAVEDELRELRDEASVEA